MIAATLPLLTAVGMWWTYFDRTAERAQARLRVHDDPVLAAADGYSYMHLIIVAGIIIFAGGVKLVVHNSVSAPMPDAGRLAMCGGAAVYLVGLAAFRLRILGEHSFGRLLVALAMLVLFAAGGGLPAWAIGAGIAALMAALCAGEVMLAHAARARRRTLRRGQARSVRRRTRGLTSGVSIRSSWGRRCSCMRGSLQRLAEVVGVLVDGEAGGEGRDLEQDPARLAEVDGSEVVAVADLGDPSAGLAHAPLPVELLRVGTGPGDVVDGAGALAPGLGRGSS